MTVNSNANCLNTFSAQEYDITAGIFSGKYSGKTPAQLLYISDITRFHIGLNSISHVLNAKEVTMSIPNDVVALPKNAFAVPKYAIPVHCNLITVPFDAKQITDIGITSTYNVDGLTSYVESSSCHVEGARQHNEGFRHHVGISSYYVEGIMHYGEGSLSEVISTELEIWNQEA